jgi:hypothetical protein
LELRPPVSRAGALYFRRRVQTRAVAGAPVGLVPRRREENYQDLKDVGMRGLYGMSSSSATELSVDQIAAVARYPNGKISYTIVPEVNALGYGVAPTPHRENPLHATIVDAPGISELSDDRAEALSALFRRHIIPNPYRAP